MEVVKNCVCKAHHLSATPRVHGKSSSGGLLTTSREFHPNCRSDRAAPIACGCGWTGVPLSFRWSLPCREQLGIHSGSYSLAHEWGRGAPCCCGLRFRASELMYLTNGYSVFKELVRWVSKKPPHPSLLTFSEKYHTFFQKNFFNRLSNLFNRMETVD